MFFGKYPVKTIRNFKPGVQKLLSDNKTQSCTCNKKDLIMRHVECKACSGWGTTVGGIRFFLSRVLIPIRWECQECYGSGLLQMCLCGSLVRRDPTFGFC